MNKKFKVPSKKIIFCAAAILMMIFAGSSAFAARHGHGRSGGGYCDCNCSSFYGRSGRNSLRNENSGRYGRADRIRNFENRETVPQCSFIDEDGDGICDNCGLYQNRCIARSRLGRNPLNVPDSSDIDVSEDTKTDENL